MTKYESKEAFIKEIQKTYLLLDKEFDDIQENQIHMSTLGVDRTPAEMIAYQLGWLNLVMSWDKDELAGLEVKTPTPEYKWNQLGPLYQSYYNQYSNDSLSELRTKFKETLDAWCNWITTLSDEELYTPGIRNWATTKANWPLWKWIHINSVAPFKTFRTKIRKWKKHTILASDL